MAASHTANLRRHIVRNRFLAPLSYAQRWAATIDRHQLTQCLHLSRRLEKRAQQHAYSVQVATFPINDELEAAGHLVSGKIGDADTLCLRAKPFIDLGLAKLAEDRWYFLMSEEFPEEE